MGTWMPYFFVSLQMGIWMPYYLTAKHIYVPGTKNNIHPLFPPLSIVKLKPERSGSQDIIIIGIDSLTIVHNRKSHIPFFLSHPFFYFSCECALYLLSFIQKSRKIQCFQGLTFALRSAVYTHPTRTGGKMCAGFWPSSSTVCFHCVSRPLFLHEHDEN